MLIADLQRKIGKENEYEESGSNAKNQLNIIDSSIMSNNNNNNNNSHSANLINNNNASEEFPILDELDRLAKVIIIFNKIIIYYLKKITNTKTDVKISFKRTND